MDKLSIQNEMTQLDHKNRTFYDDLTDEERRKFSNYLMIRWSSTVTGSRDLQEFYVIAVNERLNRHFFAVNQHPKLQWLMATSVSPGLGTQRHNWISPRKKDAADSDIKKILCSLYPSMKLSDIEVLARLVSKKDIKAYQRELGNN